jgi:phosphate transport system substrate-binding protein
MRHRLHTGRSAVAAFVLLLVVFAPVAAFAAAHQAARSTAAAAAPSATITPHTGLLDFSGDGQFVTVDWSGFAPGSPAYMRECTRDATDITSQCSQGGVFSSCGLSCPGVAYLGATGKDGSGAGVGQVAIGIINSTENLDPIPGRSFTCDYQNECSLYVLSDPFDLTTAIQVPVTFATPFDACPEGDAFTTGSGGEAAFRMFLGWSTQVCNPPQNVGLQYTLRPAQSAMQDYVDGFADYAVGPLGLDQDQQASLKKAGRTVAYAPVSLSAMVFAFHIFDQKTGNQVTNLVLSPDVLAKIFTGKIVQWNDPAIQKLNPGIHFPTFIAAITRGDANEESLTLTRWLWANARDTWVAGGVGTGITPNPLDVGPTNLIPSFGQVYLITGPAAEVNIVALGGSDFGSTSVYGTIGYVDSSWAAQYDLPTVKIRFDDGTTVAATPATITAALSHMTDCGSGLLQPDVTVRDSHVWPMPVVSYMAVPHDAQNSATPPSAGIATTLASVIRYGVGAGQEHVPAGYVPLPDSLKKQASDVAGTIMSGKPEPTPKPCTPPPPPPCQNNCPPTNTPPPSVSPSVTPPASASPTPPVSSSPTPPVTLTTVVEPPTSPPMMLAAARASVILPVMVLVGLLSMIVSPVLLLGEKGVRSRLVPAVGRIRRLSPIALIRRKGAHRGES